MEFQDALFIDLHAPLKSFRLFAIEQALREGTSQQILDVLVAREPDEDDDECRLLLGHAIEAVRKRLGPIPQGTKSSDSPKEMDVDGFLSQFAQAAPKERIAQLSRIPRNLLGELGAKAPELLEKEAHPAVASAIVRAFSRHWPKENLGILTSSLIKGSLSTRLAVLELLGQISPRTLEEYLPQLLIADDPRTRVLAILGLSRFDPEEGIAHFETLLMSNEKHLKIAAIQNGFFFPFDKLKSSLLKFFAMENDVELLNRAGILLQTNPDIEVPFKLWEIAENVPSQKAEILKGILNGAFAIIEQSGILGDRFLEYRGKLQKWINTRKATRYVQGIIDQLNQQPCPLTPADENRICLNLRQTLVREAFEKALEWQISAEARARIQTWMQREPEAASQPPNPKMPATDGALTKGVPATDGQNPLRGRAPGVDPKWATDGALTKGVPATDGQNPLREQAKGTDPKNSQNGSAEGSPSGRLADTIQFTVGGTPLEGVPAKDNASPLDRWKNLTFEKKLVCLEQRNSKDLEKMKALIAVVLRENPGNPILKKGAMKAAVDLGLKDFKNAANDFLVQNDPGLAASALEYLGVVEPEKTFPFLAKYIRSSFKPLQLAALQILQKHDPAQVVSLLKAALQEKKASSPAAAFSLMLLVDFSLVRDLVSTYLEKYPQSDQFDAGLCLFSANPAPENPYLLYRIEKAAGEDNAAKTRTVRKKTNQELIELGMIKRETSETALEEQWQKDETKAKSAVPAYAVSRIHGVPTTSFAENLKALLEGFAQRYGRPVLVGFALVVAAFFWMPNFAEKPVETSELKPGPLLPVPLTISGEVLERLDEGNRVMIKTDDGMTFQVMAKKREFSNFSNGSRIKASVIPFRNKGENYIVAHLQHLN